MKKNKILLILITINLSVCFSYGSALVCNNLLKNEIKRTENKVKLTEHNLKGFEMLASAVVWSLIKSERLPIGFRDSNDPERIDLNDNQKEMVIDELEKTFNNIFSNSKDNKGLVGYLLMSDPERFKFSKLKKIIW